MKPATLALLLASILSPLPAQDAAGTASRPDRDAELQAAYAAWSAKWKAFTSANLEARNAGKIKKGGELPKELSDLQASADAERDAVLAKYGKCEDLSAKSFRLLAELHEAARDYRSAVTAYASSIARQGSEPDLRVMHQLCIAAVNSKDDAVAAKWCKTFIAAEDEADRARRQLDIRTTFYPRALIALGDWETLRKHLATLAADEAPACKTAASKFDLVAKVHRGDVEGAEKIVGLLRADPGKYPNDQSWAVCAQLALLAHRGKFEAAAAVVNEFLAGPDYGQLDGNQRRLLAAVGPFLGKKAPKIRVDSWVGGKVEGEDPLKSLEGKVVLLDFWQPWCEPCRNAMPHLVALQKRHPAELQVLGLCRVEDSYYDVSEKRVKRPIAKADYPDCVADFRADLRLNYPLAVCDTAENNTAYKIAGIPTLVAIDRDGIVRYMSCGAGEPGLLELAVAGLLGPKVAAEARLEK